MAKSNQLQISCDDDLFKRIETYKNSDSSISSMSHAGRELIEFALLIKERSEGDASRTNREIFEELLLRSYINEEAIKRLHLSTFDETKTFPNSVVETVRDNHKLYSLKGTEKFEEFMSRKE